MTGAPAPSPPCSPDVVCFSFSFFFFLHFQGLKILPRVASLLFLLTGGVRIPETRYSERAGGAWSISSGRGTLRKGSRDHQSYMTPWAGGGCRGASPPPRGHQ